eukprot:TRINITY_DN5181_c0_g1_i2.p1 TRINITY_DN5181_c0_g1~~TRINITY_DN5181_c0_g1_i2.p1  ORF type:complete len:107 (+),score=15.38 TRINITY_DN5181_c0_g1_i2:49-369(+)
MIKFLIIANKEGQTRLSQYYEQLSIEERTTLEASLVRLCMSRTELQVPSCRSSSSPLYFTHVPPPSSWLTLCFHLCFAVLHRRIHELQTRLSALCFLVLCCGNRPA